MTVMSAKVDVRFEKLHRVTAYEKHSYNEEMRTSVFSKEEMQAQKHNLK